MSLLCYSCPRVLLLVLRLIVVLRCYFFYLGRCSCSVALGYYSCPRSLPLPSGVSPVPACWSCPWVLLLAQGLLCAGAPRVLLVVIVLWMLLFSSGANYFCPRVAFLLLGAILVFEYYSCRLVLLLCLDRFSVTLVLTKTCSASSARRTELKQKSTVEAAREKGRAIT